MHQVPMAAQKKDDKRFTEVRNSKALRDFFVDERFEAGIALKGTEVKSIRAGRAQINDAFGRVDKGELWLVNAHIELYDFGNRWPAPGNRPPGAEPSPDPHELPRRSVAHQRQIANFFRTGEIIDVCGGDGCRPD